MKAIKVYTLLLLMLAVMMGCALFITEDHIIVTPQDGQTVSGVQTIKLYITNDINVDKIDYFINSNLLASKGGTPPYQAEWDTRLFTNGTYRVSVEVLGQMNEILTDSIQVNVLND